MQIENKLEYLLEIASKFGLEIRAERLGGSGGGLCKLKGKSILFVDLDTEPFQRYEVLLSCIINFDLSGIYVLPEIRDDIDKLKSRE